MRPASLAGNLYLADMAQPQPQRSGGGIALTIIIVSWNVRELLRQCLNSIGRGEPDSDLEVIVVDSASVDGTPEMVVAEFPWVILLAQTENVGFPRGNNIGIRRARGHNILLLNPDTIVKGNALRQMVEYMEEHATVGALGPRLSYPDGTIQSSKRRFPTVLTAFFESTWLEPWAPGDTVERYRAQDVADDEIADVDWVMGAALMVRRDVVEQVGLMDEDYFMYSEELDWCRRIKDAGWRVVYFPRAEIVHYEGKSSEQAVTERHINFQRAKLRYFRKYHGWLVCSALRAYLLLSYATQLLLESAKGLVGHKRALRKQRVLSYWEVLKSGLRPAGY